jgi:hypothetical protein
VFDGGLMPNEFSDIIFSPLSRDIASIRTIGSAKNAITDLFVLYAQCALMAYPDNLSLFYKVAPYIYNAIDDILSEIRGFFLAEIYRDRNIHRHIAMKISLTFADALILWERGFKEFLADDKLEFAAQVGAAIIHSDLSLRSGKVVKKKRRVDSLFVDKLSDDTDISSASHPPPKCRVRRTQE